MRKRISLFICCLLFVLFCGCEQQNKRDVLSLNNEITIAIDSGIPVFNVNIDVEEQNIAQLLEMESFVKLSNDVVVGKIKRQIIADDRLYIWDAAHKIFCFDTNNGALLFTINSVGSGPYDYSAVHDIGLDREKKQILVYDSNKRRLFTYCSMKGNYLRNYETSRIAPHCIAASKGIILLDNPNHYNFPDDPTMHYSLQLAELESNIEVQRNYFSHDDISDYDLVFGGGHPFFYQNRGVFYNKRFDDYVYAIHGDSVSAQFRIVLDKALPHSLIKDKIQPHELVRAPFSSMLSNIYSCDGILYFTFTYDSFIYQALFDEQNGEQLYCDKMKTSFLNGSLFNWINGVTGDRFFALIDSYRLKEHSSSLNLGEIEEDGNPILFFYKAKDRHELSSN